MFICTVPAPFFEGPLLGLIMKLDVMISSAQHAAGHGRARGARREAAVAMPWPNNQLNERVIMSTTLVRGGQELKRNKAVSVYLTISERPDGWSAADNKLQAACNSKSRSHLSHCRSRESRAGVCVRRGRLRDCGS